jgi:hypothetical protein
MFPKLLTVPEHQRVLIIRNGRFHNILKPGRHLVWTHPFAVVETEIHNVRRLAFTSCWTEEMERNHPAVMAEHFQTVRTDHSQVAMIYVNGHLHQVLLPGKRLLFWKNVAEIQAEHISMVEIPTIADPMLTALEKQQRHAPFTSVTTDDSSASSLLERLFEQDVSAKTIYEES